MTEQIKTEGAVAAEQRAPEPISILAAPSTANEFNTIGERLIPKGCFRMEDVRFEFDSSFIKPEVAADMPQLADLIEKHTLKQVGSPPEDVPPPLSIFGHADPVGKDDYNKQLSGRRATAVYAMLVRDVELWEELFTKPLGKDDWGAKAIQTMLGAVGHPPGEDSKAAIKSFQKEKGLAEDGVAGPNTRKALYRAYMDFLCGPQLKLDKKRNFLAQNKDAGGKADFQGCSEFNPVLVFSKEEDQRFQKDKDKTERDKENAPNRRVMILLFAPGRRVNPKVWPCPRAKEGAAECKARFFPDANERRSPQEDRRKFEETKDTFACRFYQLITDDSPCERTLPFTASHISVLLRSNSGAVPLAGRAYRIFLDHGTVVAGKTDQEGLVLHRNVPPGDYPLEIEGLKFETLVPTLPVNVEQRTLRVKEFYLFKDTEKSELPEVDPDEDIQVRELPEEEGWEEV
ncbi:MAG: OmpA family protein [candidate division Zixibacteria bacterium]|nr:OmpA family protein [candidate division Zixibacteria bacterium]